MFYLIYVYLNTLVRRYQRSVIFIINHSTYLAIAELELKPYHTLITINKRQT